METSRQVYSWLLALPVEVFNGSLARDGQYDGHHHVGVLAVRHDAVGVLVDRVVVHIHIVVVTERDGYHLGLQEYFIFLKSIIRSQR